MSRTTFANTLDELYDLLTVDTVGTPIPTLAAAGVVAVYDHEPKPGDGLRACFVTIAPYGMDAEHWQVALRVYAAWDEGARAAQSTALAAMIATDNAMTDGFGPSSWDWMPAPDLGAFVVTNLVYVARADLST
jgi:hypothetical protein